MSNRFYETGQEAFLTAQIEGNTDTLKLALVGSGYTPNTGAAGDQWYTAISSYVIGTPVALSSVTSSGGTLSAATVTFTGVPATSTIDYLVLYKDTGTASTSQLIGIWDTATGLPLTTGSSTSTLSVVWNTDLFTL